MNFKKITKNSGVFIILYVVLLIVYSILWYVLLPHKEEVVNFALMVSSKYWKVPYYFGILAIIFGLLGTMGVLLKLSKSNLAVWGLYTIMISFMLQICIMSWEFIIWPIIVSDSLSSHLITKSIINTNPFVISIYTLFTLLFSLGNILLGISMLKQKYLSKWIAFLLIFGAPIYVFGLVFSGIVSSVGMYVYLMGVLMIGINLLKMPLKQGE